MAEAVAWWGAIAGSIGALGAVILGTLRIPEERRRLIVTVSGAVVKIPRLAESATMQLPVMITNPSPRPNAVVRVDVIFDHTQERPFLLDYVAAGDPLNLTLPVNLGGRGATGGQFNYRIFSAAKAGLPSRDEALGARGFQRWGHGAELIVTDSLQRSTSVTIENIYLEPELDLLPLIPR